MRELYMQTAQSAIKSHHVLHVIHRSGIGGLERLLLDYLQRTQPTHQSLLVLNGSGPLHAEFEALVPVLQPRRPGTLRTLIFAFQVFRTKRDHIIHFHINGPLFVLIAWVAGCRVLIHQAHGIAPHPNRIWHFVEQALWRIVVRRLSLQIAPTQVVRDILVERYADPDIIRVIHNGVDFQRFNFSDSATSTPRTNSESRVVVFVGRFEPVKQLQLWMQAFLIVAKGDPRVRAILAGTGSEEAAVRLQAAEVPGRVEFITPCMDVPALLKRASVFMSLSCRETFGLSVVEALASGVPVLVHDLPVFRELLGPTASDFMVDADCPEHVATKLCDMLANEDKYRRLAAKARDHLAALVDMPHYCDKLNDMYVLAAHNSHPLARTRPNDCQ